VSRLEEGVERAEAQLYSAILEQNTARVQEFQVGEELCSRMEQLLVIYTYNMTNGLLIYCMGKYLRISSYIRKPFLIYDFATAPL
jgi:hypothetical protein